MKTKSVEGSLYFKSNLSAETQFASASTVNSNNFYGFFDSKYIGTGNTPNWVTNSELTFLTGLTANTQFQISQRASKNNIYITYEDNQNDINYRFLTSGYNTTVSSDTNYYYTNIELSSLEVGVIYDSPSGNSERVINDYSPTGWNDGYPNNATEIRMNPTRTIILTGISGGTNGRICVIRNISKHLVILSNTSLSSSVNQFNLPNSFYFLRPKTSVTFIYSINRWVFLNYDYNLGMDYNERFGYSRIESAVGDVVTNNSNLTIPVLFDYISLSGNTNNILPTTRNTVSWLNDTLGIQFWPRNIATSPSTWGWSLSNNYDKSLYYSGKTNTFYVNIGLSIFAPQAYSGTPAFVFGWQNMSVPLAYSAATNSLTTFPNFNGGIFFVSDVRMSNSPFYCVQTSDGSSITGQTSIASIQSGTYGFGIHTINYSGDNYGESTFFTYNSSSSTLKIEGTIGHTGYTTSSTYGYWGMNNGRVTNSTSLISNGIGINTNLFLYGTNDLD